MFNLCQVLRFKGESGRGAGCELSAISIKIWRGGPLLLTYMWFAHEGLMEVGDGVRRQKDIGLSLRGSP